MKQVINGKLYNTETMRHLASKSAYNNGNYCGDASIRLTKGGLFAYVVTSNGQDLYRRSYIEAVTLEEAREKIEGWKLADEEVEALTEQGIILEV